MTTTRSRRPLALMSFSCHRSPICLALSSLIPSRPPRRHLPSPLPCPSTCAVSPTLARAPLHMAPSPSRPSLCRRSPTFPSQECLRRDALVPPRPLLEFPLRRLALASSPLHAASPASRPLTSYCSSIPPSHERTAASPLPSPSLMPPHTGALSVSRSFALTCLDSVPPLSRACNCVRLSHVKAHACTHTIYNPAYFLLAFSTRIQVQHFFPAFVCKVTLSYCNK